MKEYAKITNDGQLQTMSNPFRVVVSNPSEEIKEQLANMFNWLEVVYTEQPEYNPETQYLTQHWEEQNGKAVQVWEVYEIPKEETEEKVEEDIHIYEEKIEE